MNAADVQRWRTAYHEAGHCVAMLCQDLGRQDSGQVFRFKFKRAIALQPGEDPVRTGCIVVPLAACFLRTRPWHFGIMALAGMAAEKRLTGVDAHELVHGSGRNDADLAARALTLCGRSVAELAAASSDLVRSRWASLELVAEALLDAPTDGLTYDQVVELCRPRIWRSPRWNSARAA